MKVGDLLELDDYGLGVIAEIWFDDYEDRNKASIWLVAEQRYVFVSDWDKFNESR